MKMQADTKKVQRNTQTITNTYHSTSAVMDVLPWPDGSGFAGGDSWWHLVLSQSECDRLNNLVGLALLDGDVCERLVTKRDSALLTAFGLSERTQDWLRGINATTLKELAQAIVAATRSIFFDAAYVEAA